MRCGRVLGADVWRVAVDAREVAVFVERGEFFVQIFAQADFVMTAGACGDWDVRLQSAQLCVFRDMDVARRALCDVVLFLAAAVVNEFRGDSLW